MQQQVNQTKSKLHQQSSSLRHSIFVARTNMALNINEQARKEANLRLLQRSMDRSISNILGSATHVVLYNFQQSSQSWEKSNVEGSLFLAVRPSGYLLVILNRNSPDNYDVKITPDFQLQNNDPYLIFKQPGTDGPSIKGIWFPNAKERVLMNDMLNQVLETLKNNPPPPVPAPARRGWEQAAPSPAPAVDHGAAFAALLSPLSLGASTPGSTHSIPPSGGGTRTTPVRQASPSQQNSQPTLDKKSLQLALLSLVQDERFLDLLHAQYLKVAHARANRDNSNNS